MKFEKRFEMDSSAKSFIANYKQTHESVAKLKSVIKDGEEYGEVSDELIEELTSTYNLFTSEEEAKKRINEAIEKVKKEVTLIKKGLLDKNPEFKKIEDKISFDVNCQYFDRWSGSDGITINLIIDSDILEEDKNSVIDYNGAYNFSDSFESWYWLAWLADHESPYYSEEFLDAYALDHASSAMDQFSHTLDETDFHDTVKKRISDYFKDYLDNID